MKKFRFFFSFPVWALIILSLLCALGGIGINIYNIVTAVEGTNLFKFISFLVLCVLLAVFLLSVIIYSNYKIKGDKLYLYFGFIKTTYPLKDALNLTHFEDKNMLVLFFTEEEYTRIVINKQKFNLFAEEITKANDKISYNISKTENK